MAQSLPISPKPSVHILLTYSALITRLSISWSVREPLGITARSREATETIRSVSTTIWVFYSFADLQEQMKRYLRRSNSIPMAVLGWKSPNQKQMELENTCAWIARRFCSLHSGLRPSFRLQKHLSELVTFIFAFLVSHHWQNYNGSILYKLNLHTVGRGLAPAAKTHNQKRRHQGTALQKSSAEAELFCI